MSEKEGETSMGRAHEVRAASMAATAAKRSALFMRASKEIYMAAKAGDPDPSSNLALRSAIEKWKAQQVTKDVIDRAIAKAKGGDATAYIEGRYEFYGPGNCFIIVDTLTDNVNRALVNVRTIVTRKGGHMGAVGYNFTYASLIDIKGDASLRDQVEENLILGDVDVTSVSLDGEYVEIVASSSDLEKAKEVLKEMNITEFSTAEVTFIPNEYVTLNEEDLRKMHEMIDQLDDCEDVQNVYHNVDNI